MSSQNLNGWRVAAALFLMAAAPAFAGENAIVPSRDDAKNFANQHAQTRVVFVSSRLEKSASRMIGDDVRGAFQFAPSDPNPTVIVELGSHERVERVSAAYKIKTGRMDVFLMNELGSDPDDLSAARPIAAAADSDTDGKSAVDFDPHGARYLAFRWTPGKGNASDGFEVEDLSALGEVPLSMLIAMETWDTYANNSIGLTSPPFVTQPPTLDVVSQ
jgi:hypothetical protein